MTEKVTKTKQKQYPCGATHDPNELIIDNSYSETVKHVKQHVNCRCSLESISEEKESRIRLVGWFKSYKEALDVAHDCRAIQANADNRYKVHYCVIEYGGF